MTTALKFFVLSKDEKIERDRKQQLLNDIREIRRELDSAYSNFQSCCDEDLIEACIYEMQALTQKYQSLIKTAKKENLESPDLSSLYALERRLL